MKAKKLKFQNSKEGKWQAIAFGALGLLIGKEVIGSKIAKDQ
jgi:hypothetical protein